MDDHSQDLEIGVNIGAESIPRLRFSVAGHSTNVALSPEGATKLAGALLTSCFLCSMGRDIPEDTAVATGQIPVTASRAQYDLDTGLPTLTVSLMGGGELTFVFSPDLAVSGAAALAEAGIKASQSANNASPISQA